MPESLVSRGGFGRPVPRKYTINDTVERLDMSFLWECISRITYYSSSCNKENIPSQTLYQKTFWIPMIGSCFQLWSWHLSTTNGHFGARDLQTIRGSTYFSNIPRFIYRTSQVELGGRACFVGPHQAILVLTSRHRQENEPIPNLSFPMFYLLSTLTNTLS